MPRKGNKDEEKDFDENDLGDDFEDETYVRRKRKRKDGADQAPKILDDTYMLSSQKHLRACVYCKLLLNRDKWSKLEECPNCPGSYGIEDTTDCFESIMASIFPKVSWVAKWQRM